VGKENVLLLSHLAQVYRVKMVKVGTIIYRMEGVKIKLSSARAEMLD